MNQRIQKIVEVGRVDVTNGDDTEILSGGRVESKACASAWKSGDGGAGRSLGEKDGDLVFVNREEKQSCGLVVEVGQVCSFERGIGRQGRGVGEVEAEGETTLEPGFYRVAVGGDDLWGRGARESGEMLIE